MKKTIPITISKILFYIEEDAYNHLSKYLDAVKAHFSSYTDSREIINDIENRITEQFLDNHNQNNIVTLENVEALISSMGNVEDFDEIDATKKESETNNKEIKPKKLFRDPNDVVIGGVASGLAAYFGIDTAIMRIIFVFITLIGGSGILIYIILFLVIPEAKTSTEKLQMRGEPVTLESVSDLLKEKVNEVKKNKGGFQRIINSSILMIVKIIRIIWNIIIKLIGALFIFIFIFSIFALLFTFAIIIFNIQAPYIDFPIMSTSNPVLIYFALIAGFFAFLIPFILLLFLGIKIINRKKKIHSILILFLFGFWCLAIISVGVIGTKLIPEYQNSMTNNPMYLESIVEFPLTNFTSVNVLNNNNVKIEEGDIYKISAKGMTKDIDNLSLTVEDGILKIGKKDNFKICIFCINKNPEITIVMPEIVSISSANASQISTGLINADQFSIKASNASNIKLNIITSALSVDLSNASWSTISGITTTASFELTNSSRIDATALISKDVNVKGKNSSSAKISVSDKLNTDLMNSSRVSYIGNPTITENNHNNSKLQKIY